MTLPPYGRGRLALVGGLLVAFASAPPPAADSSTLPRESLAEFSRPWPQPSFPSDCAETNPFLFTTCYVRGTAFDTEPAVIAFRNAPDMGDHIPLATTAEVGATYGLAFDQARIRLYVAAFQRRHAHFGPLGPGGIYAIDLGPGTRAIRNFATVSGAGADEHDPSEDFDPDGSGRDWVGKTSLGDLELSADGSRLFVMNLRDRRIHVLQAATGAEIAAFDHGAAGEDWAADARPFALHLADGWLFHAVTDSGAGGDPDAAPYAVVYASREDGAEMRAVARVDLGYDRGKEPGWRAWPDDAAVSRQTVRLPHPLVTGIAFDREGNMVVGVRDRFIDTGPSISGRELFRITPGDVLLAHREGPLSWGFNSAEPKHFTGNRNDWLDSLATGAVLALPAENQVVAAAVDPLRTLLNDDGEPRGNISSGALWLDSASGADVARVELVYNELRHDGPQGKAQGLGDLALACTEQQATETPTAVSSATVTSAPTLTPPVVDTPSGDITPAASASVGATVPRGDRPSDAATPVATEELPKLPQTGLGGGSGGPATPSALLAGAAAAAVGLLAGRRRRRASG